MFKTLSSSEITDDIYGVFQSFLVYLESIWEVILPVRNNVIVDFKLKINDENFQGFLEGIKLLIEVSEPWYDEFYREKSYLVESA